MQETLGTVQLTIMIIVAMIVGAFADEIGMPVWKTALIAIGTIAAILLIFYMIELNKGGRQ